MLNDKHDLNYLKINSRALWMESVSIALKVEIRKKQNPIPFKTHQWYQADLSLTSLHQAHSSSTPVISTE